MMKIELILNVVLIMAVYRYTPNITGFSKDNPKVKTARSILVMFLILIIGKELLPYIGADKLFSTEINDKISVGITAIMIMYFGNLAPKLPNYKNIGIKSPWAMGDEKIWRKATKIFGYLSFVVGIFMFVLSFYFDSAIVVTICELIWLGVPVLYLLTYYNKKFKVS